MHDLPSEWGALCSLVLLLGMRHGLDADHLATINGFARLAAHEQRAWARWCGVFFSLGHGAVVMAVAAAVGLLSERWAPPQWLDLLGAWVSVGVLLLLGVVNLRAVLACPADCKVALVGLKGRWVERFLRARHPAQMLLVGALFAASFDTVSQAALFGITATHFGGLGPALALGLIFMLGMMLTDGLNGWWVSRLLSRSDRLAARASRVMSTAVAGLSLLVAGLGIGKLVLPGLPMWGMNHDAALSAVVLTVLASAYVLARTLARRSLAPQSAG